VFQSSRRKWLRVMIFGIVSVTVALAGWCWDDLFEKRFAVVLPGKIMRGAWQRPGPLRRIVAREGIKTIVSLTAINRDDPKFVEQAKVVEETGVRWLIVPLKGSRATIEEMAEAADLVANPDLQPVFFHCVAGHHRSNLTHAAYRMRHEGLSSEKAWDEVSNLPWSRPKTDREDHNSIEAFGRSKYAQTCSNGKGVIDGEIHPTAIEVAPEPTGGRPGDRRAGFLESADSQLRDRLRPRALSVGTNEGQRNEGDGS
jgi:protein tyrosine phosphatase (PTP) superfamily phosphohydrolase (DUF442 family)